MYRGITDITALKKKMFLPPAKEWGYPLYPSSFFLILSKIDAQFAPINLPALKSIPWYFTRNMISLEPIMLLIHVAIRFYWVIRTRKLGPNLAYDPLEDYICLQVKSICPLVILCTRNPLLCVNSMNFHDILHKFFKFPTWAKICT